MSGAVYEGNSTTHGTRVHPASPLAAVRLFSGDNLPDIEMIQQCPIELFREVYFDPVTRVRKGQIYSARHQNQPTNWQVQDIFRDDLKRLSRSDGGAQDIELVTYQRSVLTGLSRNAASLRTTKVALGSGEDVSYWNIISVESDWRGTPTLMLKSAISLGELPILLKRKVPPEIVQPLQEALEKVEDSANRQGPVWVIDRCRDALSIVFGSLAGDMTLDLGPAVKRYLAHARTGKPNMLSNAASIVARLHSRGKPNEREAKGLRSPSEQDAQFALKCLWFILVDLGWAE